MERHLSSAHHIINASLSGYYLIILIKILLFGDENVTGLHGNFV